MVEHCDFERAADDQQRRRSRSADAARRHRPSARQQARGHRRQGAARRVSEGARGAGRGGAGRRCSSSMRDRCARISRSWPRRATPRTCSRVPTSSSCSCPGEMFFSAALEQDRIADRVRRRPAGRHPREPDDADRAAAGGGVRLAAAGRWRRTRGRSASSAASLYESVRVLGGHFDALGTRLKSSLDAYNQAVGSLEGNVLVQGAQVQGALGGERQRGDQAARADRPRPANAAIAGVDRRPPISRC